jgi:hypothetical protein
MIDGRNTRNIRESAMCTITAVVLYRVLALRVTSGASRLDSSILSTPLTCESINSSNLQMRSHIHSASRTSTRSETTKK